MPIVDSTFGEGEPCYDEEAGGTDEDEEGAEAEREEREARERAGECVCAWARYNPALGRVQLDEGRAWVRRGRGWEVDEGEGEEEVCMED